MVCIPTFNKMGPQDMMNRDVMLLEENVADITSFTMAWTDEGWEFLTFLHPIDYISRGILSAEDKGEDHLSAAFIQCFHADVWLCFVVMMVLSALARTSTKKIMKMKGNVFQQVWEEFGVIFCEGIPYKDVWSEKILILNWALGTFFLMSAFGSVMTSVFTAHTENNLDSIEDVLRRPHLFPFVVDPLYLRDITTEPLVSLKRILEEKNSSITFGELYQDTKHLQKVRDKKAIVFDYIENLKSWVLRDYQATDSWHFSRVSYGVNYGVIAMRKGVDSSLTDKANVLICRFFEMFPRDIMMDYAVRKQFGGRNPLEEAEKTEVEATSLTLADSGLVFLIWSAGIGISTVVCIIERLLGFCLSIC